MFNKIPPSSNRLLADPRKRRDLLVKVESLIAILELARAKVERRLSASNSSAVQELRAKRTRLTHTLDFCHNACQELRGVDPITQEELASTDYDELAKELLGC